jgi:RNA polymerase sigma factor for flagellar operon FliA
VSDDPEVVALWRRFKADGDRDARERLILQYAPLVKYVAGRVSVGLPSTVEHGDLTSYGMFGLIDAIERFDLDKGVKFETYAISRIRGAIIDELRSLDWIPRSVRNKARRVEQAMSALEHELGRTPGEGELAGRLDVDIDELRRTLAQVSLTSVMALDEPFAGEDDEEGGSTLLDKVPDRASPDPEARVQDSEMRKVLSDSVAHLSERERTVVMLYYFEGMTLSQIGEVLSVTESRVCQIHTKAVLGLRTKITERIRG